MFLNQLFCVRSGLSVIVWQYTIQPAAVPTASWVSPGVYEAKGVNPDSKSGGRDPYAVDDLKFSLIL
jgi:hypothetical protein